MQVALTEIAWISPKDTADGSCKPGVLPHSIQPAEIGTTARHFTAQFLAGYDIALLLRSEISATFASV